MTNYHSRSTALMFAVLIVFAGHSAAQESWVGAKVFLQDDIQPRFNEQKVDRSVIGSYPATVTAVDGKKLYLGEYWVYVSEVLTIVEQATVHRVRGWSHSGRSNFEEAMAEYEKSRLLNPQDAMLYLNRGETRLAMQEPESALEDFQQAIRLAPRNPACYLARGNLLLSQGKTDAAIKDYSKLIELEPKRDHYLLRAGVLRKTGDWQGEKKDLTALIQRSPSLVDNYLRRAKACEDHGEFDAALADWNKAVQLAPTNNEYYEARARFLYRKGDAQAAKNSLTKLIELRNRAVEADPDNPAKYNLRGHTFRLAGEYAKTLEDISKAIELDPHYAPAFNARAWLNATSPAAEYRDGQQAIDDAKRACELTNWDNASYLDTLAAAYAEAGDFEKAIEWETKVLGMFAPGQTSITSDRMLKTDVEARIELFRQRQPLREL